MEKNDDKPKKVYIVEYGEYSDRYIGAVFLDKRKAEDYAKYNTNYFGDPGCVLEYDLEDDSYEAVGSGYEIRSACMSFGVSPDGKHLWNNVPKVSEDKRYSRSASNGSTMIFKQSEDTDGSVDALLEIERALPEKESPERVKELMGKILYDLSAEFEALVVEFGSIAGAYKAFRDKYDEDGDSDEDPE